MDLSLFYLKISQFSPENPEAFAKYLNEVVMNKIENKKKQIKELQALEDEIARGGLNQHLNKDSLIMKKGKKGVLHGNKSATN